MTKPMEVRENNAWIPIVVFNMLSKLNDWVKTIYDEQQMWDVQILPSNKKINYVWINAHNAKMTNNTFSKQMLVHR